MKIASLKLRAALTLSLVVTLVWLVAAAATARLLAKEMNEVFDSALQETGQRVLQLAVIDILSREEDGLTQHVTQLDDHEEYFTYMVRDAQGRVLLTSHAAKPEDFPDQAAMGFSETATHRVYQEDAVQGTIRLIIVEPMEHRQEVAGEVLLALALPLLVLIPLGLLGILWGVGFSLRPLAALRAQLAGRAAQDLAPVATDGLPVELQPIAGTLNQLFQRVDAAFEAERSFASTAAHELRTPLAGALAQVQRLRLETADADTQTRADEIEGTLKRLTRLSERLIQLARAEGARLQGDTALDARLVLRLVADDLARSGAGGRLVLDLPASAVMTRLDPDALGIVARNLMENALRHGAAGPVAVRLTADALLSVENDCPAIPPEMLAHLATRFVRAPDAGKGSGLGLAIVRTIAERLGTPLELTSPLPGGTRGFRAAIRLASLTFSPDGTSHV